MVACDLLLPDPREPDHLAPVRINRARYTRFFGHRVPGSLPGAPDVRATAGYRACGPVRPSASSTTSSSPATQRRRRPSDRREYGDCPSRARRPGHKRARQRAVRHPALAKSNSAGGNACHTCFGTGGEQTFGPTRGWLPLFVQAGRRQQFDCRDPYASPGTSSDWRNGAARQTLDPQGHRAAPYASVSAIRKSRAVLHARRARTLFRGLPRRAGLSWLLGAV